MTTLVFPGQGSQFQGMGLDLLDRVPEYEPKIDAILGYSLRELIEENPSNKLSQTEFTQPAIYVVSCLAYLKEESEGLRPNYVIGHSLGEFSACFASGIFDFFTGLHIVQKRGQIMSKQIGGAMLAILGLNESSLFDLLIEHDLLSVIDVVNYNSPSQFVLSGLTQDIEQAKDILSNANAHVVRLPVSGAFHSRHLQPARIEFMQYLMDFSFEAPKIPILSSSTMQLMEHDYIYETLGYQITKSVQWTGSIQMLAKVHGQNIFKEVGPGQVLTKLISQILQ